MQKTPILTLTSIAATAVAANRFCDFDGSQCDVAGAKPLGVSVNKAAVGVAFPVDVLGTTKVEAGAAIPLGAKGLTPVKTDANGKAIPHGGAGEIAAYALQAANGDGHVIEVLLP
ncbi:MAG TPA: capsid cement protein [Allosphingosinicella sp.]|jgi:hypothetical protein